MWGREKDTSLPEKPNCKSLVTQTKTGWKINIPQIKLWSVEIGGGGVEIEPKIIQLAGREAVILDIAQYYYCEEMARAIKSRDVKQYEEMKGKRNKTIERLVSLIEQQTEEGLKKFVSQNYEEIKSAAAGKGVKDAIAELERAYKEARPYIEVHGDIVPGKKEVGVETRGNVKAEAITGKGDIHQYHGPTTVIQQTPPELEERVTKLEEALKQPAPLPPKEEIESQIDALNVQLLTGDLESSRLHVQIGLSKLRNKEYKEAIKEFGEALKPLPNNSIATASVLWHRARALKEWPRVERSENLEMAIEDYKNILTIYAKDKDPKMFATVQHELGNAYSDLSDTKDRGANLESAIKCYKEALKIYTIDEFSSEYAMVQNSLGSAYKDLSRVRDRELNLMLAIKAHREALRIVNVEELPKPYATIQNNLGNAYRQLSITVDKEQNLKLALQCYGEALKVRTHERYPEDYAQTMNNLGTAYRGLSGVRDTEGNLKRAINSYTEALKVHTLKEFPKDYAMAQNNLGNAYRDLAEVKDKEVNLELAIRAYNEALKDFTKETMPWHFSETSFCLASALKAKGDLAEALRVMEEMLPVAGEVGHPELESFYYCYEDLKKQARGLGRP